MKIDINESWTIKKAKDLYTYCSGISKGAQYFGSGYPYLTFTEIFHNYFVPEQLTSLVESNEKERNNCSIKRGDVFLTRTSETDDELGMSCVALKDYPNATFNGFTKRLRPMTDEIVPEYAGFYFRSPIFRAAVTSMSSIITRASLNEKMLDKLPVVYPNKDAQQKIASILSAYDNLIQNYKKQIEDLQTTASELYKEWFVRFRFPGYKTTQFENGIPVGWKVERIENVGEVIGGGTPSTEKEEYWDGDIPWLSPVDLSDNSNVYVSRGSKNITELGLKKSSAKMMPKDTVLLSSRAPVGYVALAKNPICTNQGFKSVICESSKIEPMYLYFYFKMNKNYLQSIASGATFPELSGSMMKKLKVLLPPVELQKNFSDKISVLINKAELLSDEITNLTQQRDLLLPRLMSGKLEVE